LHIKLRLIPSSAPLRPTIIHLSINILNGRRRFKATQSRRRHWHWLTALGLFAPNNYFPVSLLQFYEVFVQNGIMNISLQTVNEEHITNLSPILVVILSALQCPISRSLPVPHSIILATSLVPHFVCDGCGVDVGWFVCIQTECGGMRWRHP